MIQQERQLQAIMFTDIAGFTKMMGRDSKKALNLVSDNRALQKPLIEQHGGKWLKEMGDGVLASFTSSYNAVICAIAIQQNANKDLKNKIRIGIHLGDVTTEEGDVFGDGVNIASRLESIADPGGIYISDSVHTSIRGNSDIKSIYLGEVQLKNVSEGIRTHAIIGDGLPLPSKTKVKKLFNSVTKPRSIFRSVSFYSILISVLIIGSLLIWNRFFKNNINGIQSLAVLPFTNHTGDSTQAYLASGMHFGLIGEMGQLGTIQVISRTSTLSYANTEKTIKEIASELNVDAIVEASLLRADDQINIQFNLVNAYPEERQIWSKTYEIAKENVVNLYSEVAKTVANEINIKLTPQTKDLLNKVHPINPEAYELYIKGRISLALLSPKGIQDAEQYFLKSVEIDSLFAPAYAGLSGIWIVLKQLNMISPELADPKMEEYLAKAFELDSTDAEVWRWEASKLGNTDFNWEACNNAMDKCLELNPNFSEARAFYAHILMIQNRWDEAWEQMNRAMETDPLSPLIKDFRGVMLVHQGKYEEYLRIYEPLDKPDVPNPLLLIIFSLTKQHDKAIAHLKRTIQLGGQGDILKILEETYASNGFNAALNHTADALAKINDSTHLWTGIVLQLYLLAGNTEKSLYWMEKLYIRRDPNLPYYAVIGPLTKAYQDEPRYIEIMERINLR